MLRALLLLSGLAACQAFAPLAVKTAAPQHLRVSAPQPSRFAAAPRLNLRMADEASSEIDFGKVDLSSSDPQMSGMIFRPEEDDEPESRCRVDWDIRCEKALNDQINVEYTASYAYHALFSYFDRDTVGLQGFAKFFADQSQEERGHAEEFMKYQNIRGGKVVLKPVAVPEMSFSRVDGTSDALYAFDLALQLEKFVYRKLKNMHALAEQCDDPQFCDEIENYLGEQVRAIKEMATYVAQIKRLGTGHGIWDLDKELADKVGAA